MSSRDAGGDWLSLEKVVNALRQGFGALAEDLESTERRLESFERRVGLLEHAREVGEEPSLLGPRVSVQVAANVLGCSSATVTRLGLAGELELLDVSPKRGSRCRKSVTTASLEARVARRTAQREALDDAAGLAGALSAPDSESDDDEE